MYPLSKIQWISGSSWRLRAGYFEKANHFEKWSNIQRLIVKAYSLGWTGLLIAFHQLDGRPSDIIAPGIGHFSSSNDIPANGLHFGLTCISCHILSLAVIRKLSIGQIYDRHLETVRTANMIKMDQVTHWTWIPKVQYNIEFSLDGQNVGLIMKRCVHNLRGQWSPEPRCTLKTVHLPPSHEAEQGDKRRPPIPPPYCHW